MREMSFKQTLEYVFCQCGNKKNNLSTVKETALKMGLLPVGYPAVHITGTNGKGTAATLLAEMLRQNGIKTGLFTFRDCMTAAPRDIVAPKLAPSTAFKAKDTAKIFPAATKTASFLL